MNTEVITKIEQQLAEEQQPLAVVLQTAIKNMDDHYFILAESMDKVADNFEHMAKYVRELAEKIRARNAHVQREIMSAGEFENETRDTVTRLVELARQMKAEIATKPVTRGTNGTKPKQQE